MNILISFPDELALELTVLAASTKEVANRVPRIRSATAEETREAMSLYRAKGKAACNGYLRKCCEDVPKIAAISRQKLIMRAIELGMEELRKEVADKLAESEKAQEVKPIQSEPKLKQVFREDGTPDWDATMRANGVKL